MPHIKFKYLSIVVLSLFGFAAVMNTSHAKSENQTMILFVPDTDWPPYLISDPSYPGRGVMVEILEAIAGPMGYSVEVHRLPDNRGWHMMDHGEVDVHMKAREWVVNAEDYDWTDPIMLSEDCLLYPREHPLNFKNLDELRGKTLAVIKSFVYPELEPYFESGKIHRLDMTDPYDMLRVLVEGRADAALVNRDETKWLLTQRPELNGDKFEFSDLNVDVAEYRYVFTTKKDWKPFIEVFNKELARMKKNGRLKGILNSYR